MQKKIVVIKMKVNAEAQKREKKKSTKEKKCAMRKKYKNTRKRAKRNATFFFRQTAAAATVLVSEGKLREFSLEFFPTFFRKHVFLSGDFLVIRARTTTPNNNKNPFRKGNESLADDLLPASLLFLFVCAEMNFYLRCNKTKIYIRKAVFEGWFNVVWACLVMVKLSLSESS